MDRWLKSHTGLESVENQRRNTDRLKSLINEHSVSRLTESVGYRMISFEKHKGHGVINMIYFIKTENSTGTQEFVLRVTNPWLRWVGRLSRNEATVLDIIQRWNSSCQDPERRILAPKIVSFSSDAATSILGCEYSLAEKLPGINGEIAIHRLNLEQRRVLWKDLLRFHCNLAAIPAEFIFEGKTETEVNELKKMIGSFSNGLNGLGAVLVDGHCFGPSASYATLMCESLLHSVQDLVDCPVLPRILESKAIDDAKTRIKSILERIEIGDIDANLIWPTPEKLALAHDDLHLGNILVNEDGTLSSVLDWDRIQWGLHSDYAREWCSCILDDLFTKPSTTDDDFDPEEVPEEVRKSDFDFPEDELDELHAQARKELDEIYPETADMKLRSYWTSLPNVASWVTNYLASWLESDAEVIDRSIYEKAQREHFGDLLKWLDRLERAISNVDFSTFAESSDEE